MIIFIIVQFLIIALYDIWQMAKAELLYWEMLSITITNDAIDTQDNAYKLKEKASENTSIGQFVFWYAEVIIGILALWGLSITSAIVLGLIMFLHYSGLEDWLFFVFANYIKLPDAWWRNRVSTEILFWKFPASLDWLAKTRFGFIHSYWIPLWAGKKVSAKGLTWCVAVSLIIVGIIVWIV